MTSEAWRLQVAQEALAGYDKWMAGPAGDPIPASVLADLARSARWLVETLGGDR